MLGYMTKKEALTLGFTHHGSYYGIPIWISDDDIPMVAAKWAPFELVISVVHYIEGFMWPVFFPHEQPGFQFYYKDSIK